MGSTEAPMLIQLYDLVTGASSGIGRGFAEHLTKTSYLLVATARKLSDLDYLPDDRQILKLCLDITSPASIRQALDDAVQFFGRIDVVINNAGYSLYGDTESVSDEQARAQFETNFWGAANLTREAVRVQREENPKTGQIGGVVMYMSSAAMFVTFAGAGYYHARQVLESPAGPLCEN